MENKSSKQKGITLIALVVTIVVLLILAGISISMLGGENGIIQKAKEAKDKTEQAKKDEEKGLDDLNNKINEWTGKGEERKINVAYTQSEGEELWSSTVTLTLSLEEDELTLEQKREKLIGIFGCSSYDEFKTMLAGSIENYDKQVNEMGEEAFLNEMIYFLESEIGLDISWGTLENIREIVAYMLDFSNFEEFKEWLENKQGSSYEEFLATTDYGVEAFFLADVINAMKDTLSFKDINKLESLGIKVIKLKTPYDTTLYATSMDGEVKCSFIENGSYTFKIQSGATQIAQVVDINNIRDYNEQAPHDIKVDYRNDSDETVLYTIDDSAETAMVSSEILSCNNSISYYFGELKDTTGCWISYVIKDKLYYKYFNDGTEWERWCDNRGWYVFSVPYKEYGYTCRQTIFSLMLYAEDFSEKITLSSDWADWMDEYISPQYAGETIDVEEMLRKYPQAGIGVKEFVLDGEEAKSINFTKDTNIYVVSQHCLTTDTYVIVVAWDEEKKKRVLKRKKLKDVTYEDELLVWDFDKGEFATAKPLWIMKTKVADRYNLLKFSDGSELKTIEQHRIFNKEKRKFTYPMTDETPIGTTTFTAEGKEVKLVSKEVIAKEVEFANIITKYHMNVFANNILTSCRFSNLYPIEDMKYVKDNRKIKGIEEYKNIPEEYYYGLRLGEQSDKVNIGNDVAHASSIEEHIQKVYIENSKESV